MGRSFISSLFRPDTFNHRTLSSDDFPKMMGNLHEMPVNLRRLHIVLTWNTDRAMMLIAELVMLGRDMMRVTRDRALSWHPIITRSISHSCPNNSYTNWLDHNKHSQLFCANNNIFWITQPIVKSSPLASVLLQETWPWYRELVIQDIWMEFIGLLAKIFKHLCFALHELGRRWMIQPTIPQPEIIKSLIGKFAKICWLLWS